MNPRSRRISLLLLASFLLSACGMLNVEITQPSPRASAAAAATPDLAATVAAQVQATLAAERAQAAASPSAAATVAPTATPSATEAVPPTATTSATETLPTTQPTTAPTAQPVVQSEAPPAMLLILDSSGSMLVDDGSGQPKIAAAKEALNALVEALPDGAPVGLRVYGHRVPNTDKVNGCRDTELIMPIAPLDKTAMKSKIDSFSAVGYTPIALSLEEGFKDLPPEGRRTMVLVSDGEETCDRDPCEVAANLKAQGVDLIVETVGFQVDEKTRAQLQCIAEKTGGEYHDAQNAAELADQLKQLSTRALREYDVVGKPIEGGTSFNSPLTLQPGQYTQTMQVGETLYYGIELKEHQAVRVTATLLKAEGEPILVSGFATWFTPQRERRISSPIFKMSDQDPQSAAIDTLYSPVENRPYALYPVGLHYLTLEIKPGIGSEEKAKGREFTWELIIEVLDVPTASP